MAKRTAVGLDIGSTGVRAAELSLASTDITLERFGQIALPDGAVVSGEIMQPEAVTEALRELWTSTRFTTRKVILGIANQRVAVRTVDLPQMDPKSLKASLPFQVQDLIPMPVDQAILDFHSLENVEVDGHPMVRGMLVAATRDTVERNVRCVHNAGLEPVMMDLSGFAVLRSIGRHFDPMVDTEAIVDIGAQVTNLVVHSGGYPRFVRILMMGGEDITDAIVERLGVARPQAQQLKERIGLVPNQGHDPTATQAIEEAALRFVDEVRGSLDFYMSSQPSFPIDRVTVSGGASCLPGLLNQLAAATRFTVQAADPIGSLRLGDTGLDDDQLRLVQPLSAVPVGLALSAV